VLVRTGGEGDLKPEAVVIRRAVGPGEVAVGVLILQAQPDELALPEGQVRAPGLFPQSLGEGLLVQQLHARRGQLGVVVTQTDNPTPAELPAQIGVERVGRDHAELLRAALEPRVNVLAAQFDIAVLGSLNRFPDEAEIRGGDGGVEIGFVAVRSLDDVEPEIEIGVRPEIEEAGMAKQEGRIVEVGACEGMAVIGIDDLDGQAVAGGPQTGQLPVGADAEADQSMSAEGIPQGEGQVHAGQ